MDEIKKQVILIYANGETYEAEHIILDENGQPARVAMEEQ